ncbi:hypothetical protein [Mangrovimonas cancribranchiae]|uniref:YobI-like P-loop NTPase domain-containing protein n=1 Tax=Mangrovimonas cancribranchiae TaxID=3080055 RepID=A0AAU6NXG8_9FLAO
MLKNYKINLQNIKSFFKELKKVLKSSFLKEKVEKETNDYDSLSPTVLSEEDISVYNNALKVALEDEEIKNIALTGVYGSGKSSIIKTFQKLNPPPKYHYLNISLAAFKPVETNGESDEIDDLERLLELSILQQLFYHVKHNKIPDSRFRRIKSLSKWRIGGISFSVVLWIISYFILFKESLVLKIIPENWEFIYFQYVALLLILLGLGLFAGKIVRVLNNSKLNKLNVQSWDFELNDNIDQSIINKNIDEIIYFFEKTPFNVIVIEDLDRFENTEIFSKLREINLLLNSSEQVGKRVVFVYAVRDDLFEDYKHRTKFFDFLIPVIPIINPSNANEKLIEKLNNLDSDKKPDEDFIDEVSFFINDMRLLKNIWNEYLIYKDNLSDSLLQDKLFAMVIYKNLYPKDFSELNNNKGKLFELISKKDGLIKENEKEIENKIEEIRLKIEKVKKEQIKNENELRAVYVNALFELIPKAILVEIDGEILGGNELVKKENFDKLKSTKNIKIITFSNHNLVRSSFTSNRREEMSGKGFNDIEKKVNPNLTFDMRLSSLNKETLDNHSKKIEDLKREKEKIRQLTLSDIIEKSDKKEVFGNYLEDKLIVYLVSEGYINEQYSDYISYFHEISLTKQDYDFLQGVLSGVANDFSFKLKNIEKLLKRLSNKNQLRNFNSNAIFNYSLLDFILTNELAYQVELNLFFKNIIKKSDNGFVDGYVENGKQVSTFIRLLCNKWKGFWNFLEVNSDYTVERKDEYLQLLLNNADAYDIWIQMNESNLKPYVENKIDFFDKIASNVNADKLIKVIEELKLKLKHLTSPTNENEVVFDYVYNESQYELNSNNIKTLLLAKASDVFSEAEIVPSYKNVLNSKLTGLINYVEEKINTYIEDVVFDLDDFDEDERSYLKLLNNSNIDEDSRIELINKSNLYVENLNEVVDLNIKEYLVDEIKIANSWNNVFEYYDSIGVKEEDGVGKGFDEVLVGYLNEEEVVEELSKSKLNDVEDRDSDYIKTISKMLLLTNEISDEAFSKIIKSIPYKYNSLGFENLSSNKVGFMIEDRFLNLTTSNYNLLKLHFPHKHINLIEKFINEFLTTVSEYDFDSEDFIQLIKNNKTNKDDLASLVPLISENLIVGNKDLSALLCEVLSASRKVVLSYKLLNSLFVNGKKNESKIILLNKYFEDLNKGEVKTLVSLLSYPYNKMVVTRKRPKIKLTRDNTKLVENLKSRDLIASYEYIKDSIKVVAKY